MPPTTPGAATPRRIRPGDGGDACPGAVRLHEAADGALARIRLPGGFFCAQQADALADLALELADGDIHLTARGNAEIRGVNPEGANALTTRLAESGLLPSVTHERMRNVLATPLAGLDGAGSLPTGAHALVDELDHLLTTDPDCAALSGRFLFGIDDGRGDVLLADPDLAAVATERGARLYCAGRPLGVLVDISHAPVALHVMARIFVQHCRSREVTTWRVADLEPAQVHEFAQAAAEALGRALPTRRDPDQDRPLAQHPGPTATLGVFGTGPFAVGFGLPLGVAPAATWHALAQISRQGDELVRTTSARGVIVSGLALQAARAALRQASDLGLITDAQSDYARLSACTGLPGCASSRADLRTEIHASAQASSTTVGRALLHVSGCERRCGHPRTPHMEAVATGTGYALAQADGSPMTGQPTSEQIETMSTAMRLWRNA